MIDTQYITKSDLKTFGRELVGEIKEELETRLEDKFQLMREEIRRENSVSFQEMRKENKSFYDEIKKDNATYYGLIREDFKHKFDLMKEYLIDVPDLARELRNKAEENEYDHKEFRMRLGVLERSK